MDNDLDHDFPDWAAKLIGMDPNRAFGKPTVGQTRLAVSHLLEHLAGRIEQIVPLVRPDFPFVSEAEICAALLFAAAVLETPGAGRDILKHPFFASAPTRGDLSR